MLSIMTPSAKCYALIEQWEHLELTAYPDQVGVWTIGYGHTGRGVRAGMTVTEDQAYALLQADVSSASGAVNQFVKVPLTQNEFDALVSFTFNLGAGALASSTLLRLLNSGATAAAALQFPCWDHEGKLEVQGLLNRRLAEQALFLEAA